MPHLFASRGRLLVGILRLLGALALIALLAAGWFYYAVRASLPQLDGTQRLEHLDSSVTITRDGRGVPTVRGSNRMDVARAFGFLHAQERFFQMDLLRRRAAGELSALFGEVALPMDRHTAPHRFRVLAQKVFADLPPAHRDLLEAYTAGVNAGTAALGQKPFEYLLLRSAPVAWKPEDSVLIIYAMTLDLQDASNTYERSLATVRDQLGMEAVAFFAPLLTPNDAAMDGTTGSLPPPPGPDLINLRTQTTATSVPPVERTFPERFADVSGELRAGSNSFALTGAHTASGAALLANDPHLNLGLPNIWYRAVLEWSAVTAGTTSDHRVVGVSLPGLPFIVLGSNGQVAWGLTDAYADTNDFVAVEVNPLAASLYKIPGSDELVEIETRRDAIAVKGRDDEIVETSWTHWGPVLARDFRDRPLAHRWVAYDPAATNLNFIGLETARTVTEAIAIAQASGIPANNFLVADRAGDVAWTIAGKYPQRVGFDGRLPVSWNFGDRRWDGFVPADQVPVISTAAGTPGNRVASETAASGRLWTANNRLVGGADLLRIGDGGYSPPPRAAQIRDQLATLQQATPRDFLALQRDDRGLFLDRWQKLLLAVLTPENIAAKNSRAELRRLIASWDGRARVDSVSYRLVRTFRSITAQAALAPVFASCVETGPTFDWLKFNFEPALWVLLTEKPLHLLDPRFATWDELLLAAADRVISETEATGVSLEKATWGQRNQAVIRHPLAPSLPLGLGRWLSLPNDPLPGDIHMPLIQSPSFGASMRLVVSPGREDEALFAMPGGQSGHPLSPFYRAGHEAWVRGEAMALLPGETRHTLQLTP